jgi:ATPase subunit of ABC transporter with duplicated ATPase domains
MWTANHLDLGACVWLEEYLSTYDKCLVVVSHSQDFLNGVCTNIMDLDHKKKLTVYGGNYDQYVQTKAENEVNQVRQAGHLRWIALGFFMCLCSRVDSWATLHCM